MNKGQRKEIEKEICRLWAKYDRIENKTGAADDAAQRKQKLDKIFGKIEGIYCTICRLGYYVEYHDAANGEKEYWTLEKV